MTYETVAASRRARRGPGPLPLLRAAVELRGAPDEMAGQLEELARGLTQDEYISGTWLRKLVIELARRPGFTVTAVTPAAGSQEFEISLSGGAGPVPVFIYLDDGDDDDCRITRGTWGQLVTWDRWVKVADDSGIQGAADYVAGLVDAEGVITLRPGPGAALWPLSSRTCWRTRWRGGGRLRLRGCGRRSGISRGCGMRTLWRSGPGGRRIWRSCVPSLCLQAQIRVVERRLEAVRAELARRQVPGAQQAEGAPG
jgi:hypothetical protein